MRLAIKVAAGASRDVIRGWMGDTLKVAVTAAPERGHANAAVAGLLAAALGVPASAIRIVAGHTSRRKTVEIAGVAEADLCRRLGFPR